MVFFFALIDSEARNKCTGVFFFHSVLNWSSFYFFLLKVIYYIYIAILNIRVYICIYIHTHNEINHNKIKFANDKKKYNLHREDGGKRHSKVVLFFFSLKLKDHLKLHIFRNLSEVFLFQNLNYQSVPE